MIFQALFISLDNSSGETLSSVCQEFLLQAVRCSHADVASKLQDERFEVVAIDLDQPQAVESLAAIRQSSRGKTALILGLLDSPDQAAFGFGAGTNFILYKPLTREYAVATIRAIVALAKRERRRQFRVPVQLPVTLTFPGAPTIEGIMLDLSEGGMDVLAAKPMELRQDVEVQFALNGASELQVRGQVVWANPNGQSGLQLLDVLDEQRQVISEWLMANAPQAVPEDTEPLEGYKLSDLSSGACYVETIAPFPKGTRLDLCFRVPELEVHLDGTVRVVHPVSGMGVEFAHTRQQRDSVETFIAFLSERPGISPELTVLPKAISFNNEPLSPSPENIEVDDCLLRLLHESAHLGKEEFLAELQSHRRPRAAATSA
jgi:DNA-binding response OmpR family regulator